jgi:hypothetical protein
MQQVYQDVRRDVQEKVKVVLRWVDDYLLQSVDRPL